MTATAVQVILSPVEMEALEQLCNEHQMPKTALIRQALRTYQCLHERTKAGDKISLNGQYVLEFVGPGFGQDLRRPVLKRRKVK